MIAAHGSTTEQPAVMAANPPRSPLHTSVTFQAAVHPASVVVTAVLPTALHWPVESVPSEPEHEGTENDETRTVTTECDCSTAISESSDSRTFD
ncbi:hypothetical protein F8388_003249 [Cannabis sativa]|uniref:Uncharacterized protein n=1 Tax=Cannabis sativa TaxID=3483 RepID=A0A7J6DZW4_CANSA|nr:hypothetical protein F8388_003249 [Cannabis sativa]